MLWLTDAAGETWHLLARLWKKRWERGCSRGDVRECCAADEELLLGIFCPGTCDLGEDT